MVGSARLAASNVEATVSALLGRHWAPCIRPSESEIAVHRERRPGWYHRPVEPMRAFIRNGANHALIVLDHAWKGVPLQTGSYLESLSEDRLGPQG